MSNPAQHEVHAIPPANSSALPISTLAEPMANVALPQALPHGANGAAACTAQLLLLGYQRVAHREPAGLPVFVLLLTAYLSHLYLVGSASPHSLLCNLTAYKRKGSIFQVQGWTGQAG